MRTLLPISNRAKWEMESRRELLLAGSLLVASGCTSTAIRSQSPEKVDTSDADTQTELIGEVASPYGLHYVRVEGPALVTGLKDTGSDPPPSAARTALVADMQARGVVNINKILASPTTSLVWVKAYLPPGVQKGDPLDVEVRGEELASLFTLAADHTALSLEQSWRVLRAAQTHGLRRRLELSATSHSGVLDFADELGIGAIVLLDEPSASDLERLADSAVTVILSVGADGIDEWGKRTARRLIELGVPVALGTGGSPVGRPPCSMLEAIRFACGTLGMTPAEALIAATINGAFASGLGDDVGPLEPGKRADLLILSSPSYARLPYDASDDPIRAVVKDGWLVVDQGARVA